MKPRTSIRLEGESPSVLVIGRTFGPSWERESMVKIDDLEVFRMRTATPSPVEDVPWAPWVGVRFLHGSTWIEVYGGRDFETILSTAHHISKHEGVALRIVLLRAARMQAKRLLHQLGIDGLQMDSGLGGEL